MSKRNKHRNRPLPDLQAPAPSRAPFDRSKWMWMAGLFLGVSAIYIATQDHLFDFDGLLQAGMIEVPLFQNPPNIVYEWNHFLWYPTLHIFYLLTHKLGSTLRGYETVQFFNSLLAAGGIVVMFLTLSRIVSRRWAAAWSVVAALTQVYWCRSTQSTNYLSGTFWLICFCWFMRLYWERDTFGNLVWMSVCATLALLFHFGNFAIFAALGLVVILKHWKDRGRMTSRLIWATLLVGLMMIPYATVYKWFEPNGFHNWWIWATGLVNGLSPVDNKTGGINLSVFKNIGVTILTYLKSFIFFNQWQVPPIQSILFLGLTGWVVREGLRAQPPGSWKTNPGWLFGIPLVFFLGLYTLWLPGNIYYWCMHPIFTCMMLACFSYPGEEINIKKPQWICMGALIVLLGTHNFRTIILTNYRGEEVRPFLNACRVINQVTQRESPILISGRTSWNMLKPYIPYFCKRPRLAIDLFIINSFREKIDPMQQMHQALLSFLSVGIPVYITQDALDSKDAFGDFRLPPQAIEAVWKPFTLLPVAKFDGNPPNALYLMWANAMPKPYQDAIVARLIDAQLWNQVLMVYQEQLKANPSDKRLRAKIQALQTQLANGSSAQ